MRLVSLIAGETTPPDKNLKNSHLKKKPFYIYMG